MPRKDNGTRQRILDAAIELFYQKGYDQVSINTIAQMTDIRGSSVYNHFKSKQEIFNTILENFKKELNNSRTEEDPIPSFLEMNSLKSVLDSMTQAFMTSMKNPTMLKMWRILAIERYRNEEARHFFQKVLVDDVIEYFSIIFSRLAQKELILSNYDSKTLATEYHSFFIFMYFRYFELAKELNGIDTEEIIQLINAHNSFFVSSLIKDPKNK